MKSIKIILLCVSSPSGIAWAQADPCSTFADLTAKSSPNTFVGYANSSSQQQAQREAQVDLASRIRQVVSASSTVTQSSSADPVLSSSSKSAVSEILIGAKVLRRCAQNGGYSTVVTLEKNLFVHSLEKKLLYNVDKAQKFITSIQTARSDDILAQNVDFAKKFVVDHQSSFESDLELCKIYNGCAEIKNEHIFSDLQTVLSPKADQDQYVMTTAHDAVSKNFRDEIVGLVEKEGLKVQDGTVSASNVPAHRKIFAQCTARVGTPVMGGPDKVVETKCTVEAYIGKQKTLRKTYSCQSMADLTTSKQDAINACSGRLQAD